MLVRSRREGALVRPAGPQASLRAVIASVVAVAALLGACSPSPRSHGTPVDVTLRDFRIGASTESVAGSNVVFQVHNAAPVTHEFVVVPTDLPSDALPLASDGLSVDEDAFDTAGELSEVPAGTTADLELRLPPGRYVFFCNLEGHYLGGMHGTLQVTGTGSHTTDAGWQGAGG